MVLLAQESGAGLYLPTIKAPVKAAPLEQVSTEKTKAAQSSRSTSAGKSWAPLPKADVLKRGRRETALRDRGPPGCLGGQSDLLRLSSADPALPMVEQDRAAPRPGLFGQRVDALARDVRSHERLGITEHQRNFFLIPSHWFKPWRFWFLPNLLFLVCLMPAIMTN